MNPLALTKLSETATTITFGWSPVGTKGYRFSRSAGNGKFTNTWDSTRHTVTFSKDSTWYKVEALDEAAEGIWPPPVTPPSNTSRLKGINVYRTSDLQLLAGLGIKHVRADYWLANDHNFQAECRRLGIKILAIACYGDWNGVTDHIPPPDAGSWADKHVAPINDAPDLLDAMAVWNEPFMSGFWQPHSDPVGYLALVKAFATAAWEIKSDLIVLFCCDYFMQGNNPSWKTPAGHWQDNLLLADTTKFLNDPRLQPEVHCYCQTDSPDHVGDPTWAFNRWHYAREAMLAHGHPNPRPWNTEYGWESITPGQHGDHLVTEQQQHDFTKLAIDMMIADGTVDGGYYYMAKTGDSWSYNLLRNDGTLKPAAQVFA